MPRLPHRHHERGTGSAAASRARSSVLWASSPQRLPEGVFPIAALGWCKFLSGSIAEVIPRIEQAIRLSPRDPAIPIWYQRIGMVHLVQSHINEAIVWLEKARNANPAHPLIRANLASA